MEGDESCPMQTLAIWGSSRPLRAALLAVDSPHSNVIIYRA